MRHNSLKQLMLAALLGVSALVSVKASDASIFGTNTLFIEAEDVDFGHGKYVTDKKIGMDGPYPGGSYAGLGTTDDLDFDWHAEGPNNQAYRPTTGLSAGKEKGSAGNDRGTFTVTDWWTLGWNNGGDWYNYTRNFPTNATDYLVYGHLASGGNAINIELDQITAGQGQDDTAQVKKTLGFFAPGRATAGWDSLEIFPLVDTNGAKITVKLGGKTTLRAAMMPGSNEDLDYLAFVPVFGPYLSSASPASGATGVAPDSSLKIQLTDLGKLVNTSSVQLKFNGTNVNATVTKAGAITTITFTPTDLLKSGSVNTVGITFADNGTPPSTNTITYSFTASFYDASFALTDAEVVAAKKNPGFFVQLYALDLPSQSFPNDNNATEQALTGEWGPNVGDLASGFYTDQSQAIPNLRDEPATIDYAQGNVPGIPSLASQYGSAATDNFAMAFYTALEFTKAGTYTLGVNSDDGFRTYMSTNELSRFQDGAIILGEFNGGRGTADSLYQVYIPKPGLYPFRTTYEEGGGGYAVHWFSVNPDGTQTLINDLSQPTAIKAYRWISQKRAYIHSFPGNIVPMQPTVPVSVTISDGSVTKFVTGSAKMTVNGTDVTSLLTITAGTGKSTLLYQPAVPFARDSQVSVTLTYNESTTPVTTVTNIFTFKIAGLSPDLFPTNSFWIEAEDFNYEGGKTKPEASKMPYLGGAYDSLAGAFNIDYNNNDAFESKAYRNYDVPDLSVSGQSIDIVNTQGNRYADTRPGGVTMTVAYRIGWVDDGEWYDYTRTVPAGVYTAYAALSYGDVSANSMRGKLSIVTAGAGTTTQTLRDVGTFNQAGSGAWGQDSLVPMRGPSGGPAYYKFDGNPVTLRFTTGSGDFDWFILTPATGVSAVITSSPGGRSIHRDGTLTWTTSDFNTAVVTNTIKVQIDGADVTAKAGISKAGDITTVTYSPATLYSSGVHAWSFSFSDNATPPKTTTTTNTFLVNPYPTAGTFLIEAEDFDYNGGRSNPKAGTAGSDVNVMPYTGGAYTNLSAVLNVDYSNNDGLDSQVYRSGGPLDIAGTHVDIADNIGGVLGSDRGSWTMLQNFKIGWTDSADWGNYTRVFPANTYEVWAALSHGDALGTPNDLRGTLQLVTAGVGTTNQTLKQLGRFNGPSAGGWSNNELVPLTDTNNVKQVVSLSGTNTVRFTMDSGDFDYFIFVPAGATGPKFGPVTRNSDGSVTITWTGGGTLQTASSVLGPWTDVAAATSPYKWTPGNTKILFARIKQ